MQIYILNINVRTFIVRRLRRLSIFNYLFPLKTGGTSRYGYTVWMNHLIKLNSETKFFPDTVAELGPGDSLGVGLSALLSGVSEYVALDIQNYYELKSNLKILDELVILFRSKASISPDKDFPSDIISDEMLRKSLASFRIELIRKELINPTENNKMIRYFAPWTKAELIRYKSIDLILSQCVLEHVDELEKCYQVMSEWLKDGAFMSHLIDFKCHEFTKSWNGHWTLSESKWKFLRGGNDWAINRMPFSVHLDYAKKYGFSIIRKDLYKEPNKMTLGQLSDSFSTFTKDDIEVSSMYLLAQKKS